jgi:hypothetical protein
VHFHLKNYFTPKNKIIQDLSEKSIQPNGSDRAPYIMLPPSVSTHGWTLNHTQSRQSPYCHKAALEVHLNMEAILISLILSGNPEQYPELHICTSMCPRTHLLRPPLIKPLHPGSSFLLKLLIYSQNNFSYDQSMASIFRYLASYQVGFRDSYSLLGSSTL